VIALVFLFVLALPVLPVWAACRAGFGRGWASSIFAIALGTLLPPALLFVLAQQGDSISAAAAFAMAPAYAAYCGIASVFTWGMSRPE
jgi:hypothetical protein